MIRIQYTKVPLWLQDSCFYANLCGDEEDGFIEIPSKCFRETDIIHTINDLVAVLTVIRFWAVKQIPQSVFEFCSSHDSSMWEPTFVNMLGDNSTEHKAVVLACRDPLLFTLSATLTMGLPELESFWLNKSLLICEETKHSITQACRFGRVDLVETLRKRGFEWDSCAFCAAAQYGHLEVLHYLHDEGCSYDGRAQLFAARGGQLECMKYLHSIGSFLDESVTMEFAVPAHYAFLKLSGPGYRIPWTDDFNIAPPVNGYIQCLRFVLKNGGSIHKNACGRAAQYGLLNCLELFHQYHAPWDTDTAVLAVRGGHIDCITYLHDNGCPFDYHAIESAAAVGNLSVLQYLNTFVIRDWNASATIAAAGAGHLHCLQFLHENRYAWSPATAAQAAFEGHLECLQYVHMHGSGLNEEAPKNAAFNGHLPCLEYLHKYNCPWNNEATANAAMNNHLACLQFLHENGCPWDEVTVLVAAQKGHIECLRYAIENGCLNIEALTLKAAAGATAVDCLKYLIEERGVTVPMDGVVFGEALIKARFVNMQYLAHKGFYAKSLAFL